MRSKTWNKRSLHYEIDGKVNVVDTAGIKQGDKGIALSRLAPIGKILIHGKIVEAKSEFGLIDEQKEIEVVSVEQSSIIVKNKSV